MARPPPPLPHPSAPHATSWSATSRASSPTSTCPLAPAGTDFQLRVWQELQRIPYGESVSYGELAARIGRPGAARAVGLANGRNPIAVIVPCHRVIGADGSLTGFGGGIERKRALLELEAGRTALAV